MGADLPDLLTANRRFYDQLWSATRLIGPARFNTWPVVESLAAARGLRLELGAGLRPRLPIAGTVFADLSLPSLRPLQAGGGHAAAALATALPFRDAAFHLLCAMDVIEHVADDGSVFAELARVAAPGAILLLSVPLHRAAWSGFDEAVGHHRRYEPEELLDRLRRAGFTPERSAPSGMLPRSRWLQALGIWFLRHQRRRAMWWYDRVFMPLGLWRAQKLVMTHGMVATGGLAGVLLLCRKSAP